jgi:hypothetical protein
MVNGLTGDPARRANMAPLPMLWHRETAPNLAFI